MRKYRSLSAAVFVVVLCALAGGFSGRRALAQDQLDQQYRVLADALQAIEDNYVGETESDRLVYSAISGMLQTLDPHSSFMSPNDYRQMRERQEGRYFGLGIQIGAIDGDLTISQVFEGSPAYEKGLRRGDVIARIEKDNTKGWTTNNAVEKLRGPRGTSVNIGIRRVGYDKLIDLQVPRDAVLMATVPVSVMLDASTGYIRVSDFGENTDRELGDALRDLTRKGMTRLVFDLRENPGGALDQLPEGICDVSSYFDRGSASPLTYDMARAAIEAHGGNRTRAAEALGLSLRHLHRVLRKGLADAARLNVHPV